MPRKRPAGKTKTPITSNRLGKHEGRHRGPFTKATVRAISRVFKVPQYSQEVINLEQAMHEHGLQKIGNDIKVHGNFNGITPVTISRAIKNIELRIQFFKHTILADFAFVKDPEHVTENQIRRLSNRAEQQKLLDLAQGLKTDQSFLRQLEQLNDMY